MPKVTTYSKFLLKQILKSFYGKSGITGMGKRNIVGVRCSIRLEVPIAEAGDVLVPESYLRFLTASANQKMKLNRQRSDQFMTNFIAQVSSLPFRNRSITDSVTPIVLFFIPFWFVLY